MGKTLFINFRLLDYLKPYSLALKIVVNFLIIHYIFIKICLNILL